MNRKPNILVIQADQLATGALGAYQNQLADTPHIDSLAANGSIFRPVSVAVIAFICKL